MEDEVQRRTTILATWYLSALVGVRRRVIFVTLSRAFRLWSLLDNVSLKKHGIIQKFSHKEEEHQGLDDEEGQEDEVSMKITKPRDELCVQELEKLGRMVYEVGEKLYGCVDADIREWNGSRPPVYVDYDKLKLFRSKLRKAAAGEAGRILARCAEDCETEELGAAFEVALEATRNEWLRRRREMCEAPIITRSRKHWRTDELYKHRPCRRTGCTLCSCRAQLFDQKQIELGAPRPDAGPKEYWNLLTRSSAAAVQALTDRTIDLAALEIEIWHIALFVRFHDRQRGLRLSRTESQRKIIDLRLYELIVLYLSCKVLPNHIARARRTGST